MSGGIRRDAAEILLLVVVISLMLILCVAQIAAGEMPKLSLVFLAAAGAAAYFYLRYDLSFPSFTENLALEVVIKLLEKADQQRRMFTHSGVVIRPRHERV